MNPVFFHRERIVDAVRSGLIPLLIFLLAGCFVFGESRTWTDVDGRQIEATPLGKTENDVTVRRSDGRLFTIPLVRLIPEDRAWVASWEAPDAPAVPIDEAVVLIETPTSRGTGFLATLQGRVYLITNQHVIEGCQKEELKIVTLRGREIRGLELEVSPTQDLARVAVVAPAGLPVRYDIAHEADVVAYGNSQGGGVATSSAGKVVGVAHDILEVTAEIVRGNSGGPVIDKDGFVVGVASFVTAERKDPDDWVTSGTRYENPRRFAIRLRDNLEWKPVDWRDYATETRYLQNAEMLLEQAIEVAGAIISNPTDVLEVDENHLPAVQEIVEMHNQHVRRFESKIGRTVSSRRSVGSMNETQNANYRARLRRIDELLAAEAKRLRAGRPRPSTPYLSDRLTNFEAAVSAVNQALEKAMKVEHRFYRIQGYP